MAQREQHHMGEEINRELIKGFRTIQFKTIIVFSLGWMDGCLLKIAFFTFYYRFWIDIQWKKRNFFSFFYGGWVGVRPKPICFSLFSSLNVILNLSMKDIQIMWLLIIFRSFNFLLLSSPSVAAPFIDIPSRERERGAYNQLNSILCHVLYYIINMTWIQW